MTTTFGQDLVARIKEEKPAPKAAILTILGFIAWPFVAASLVTANPIPERGVGNPTIEYLNTYSGALETWWVVMGFVLAALVIVGLFIAVCEVAGDRRFDRQMALSSSAAT